MNDARTLCVILHYGSESDTWLCVDSLLEYDFLDILIADNDPAQNIKIPVSINDKVSIFRTGGSAGFAEANNMAVKACVGNQHDSVFILNNDTVALPGSVESLRKTVLIDDVGAVGPCMPYLTKPDKIWACGGYINKYRLHVAGIKNPSSNELHEVDYLPGAAIMCRLDVWNQVGGLPEKYFLAYEEAEFALRVRKLNYKIMVDPNAKILHKVGMSSDLRCHYIYNGVRSRIRLGQYIWGEYLGRVVGFTMTLIDMRSVLLMKIWFKAVLDEVRGVPLNRATLINAERYFKGAD